MVSGDLIFGIAAPFYNLILSVFTLFLFICFFKAKKKLYGTPWKALMTALLLFIMEALFILLRRTNIFLTPGWINSFFELAIACAVIYALMLQKGYIKKEHMKHVR